MISVSMLFAKIMEVFDIEIQGLSGSAGSS